LRREIAYFATRSAPKQPRDLVEHAEGRLQRVLDGVRATPATHLYYPPAFTHLVDALRYRQ